MAFDEMLDTKDNPWSVSNIEEFLYFCCPECDVKHQSRDLFLFHAFETHPLAESCLKQFKQDVEENGNHGYEPMVEIKQEQEENIDYDQYYEDFEYDEESDEDYQPVRKAARLDKMLKVSNAKQSSKKQETPKVKKEPKSKKELLDVKDLNDPSKIQCYKCCETMAPEDMEGHMKLIHEVTDINDCGPTRKFQCHGCLRALASKTKRQHKCSKTPAKGCVKALQCKTCHKLLSNIHSLRRHIKSVHEDGVILKCEQCDFSTTKGQSSIDAHVHRKHSGVKTDYFCCKCGKAFTTNAGCKTHENVCLGGKSQKFRCDRCDMDIFGDAAYRVHNVRVHHEKRPGSMPCETCGKTFVNQSALNHHRKMYHPTSIELAAVECKCSKCLATFKSSLELNHHLSRCLESFEFLTCVVCQSKWLSTGALKKHAAEEHQINIWICDACTKNFTDYSKLQFHKNSVHKAKVEYDCKTCSKKFSSTSSLNRHCFSVHGDMSVHHFTCPHCEMKFSTKANMKDHINAEHTKETLYQCDSCDFKSYRLKNYQSHVKLVHEKHRPFKCDQCTAAFYYKRDLANHQSRNHRL